MKSVLISIRPNWCAAILNGEKSFEVRKTVPKLNPPFRCFVYCTRTGRPLVYGDVRCMDGYREKYTQTYGYSRSEASRIWNVLNGKIVAEFICTAIIPISVYYGDNNLEAAEKHYFPHTCMTDRQIIEYLGNGKTGYCLLIEKLRIYDDGEEKELCEFGIKRPPQSWCYVSR